MLRASKRKKLAEENILRLANQFREYFVTEHRYEFVRRLGKGSAAGTLLFTELEDQKLKKNKRYLVVKFPFSEYENRNLLADDEIRNKRQWLTLLRGDEHIVKFVADTIDDPDSPRPAIVTEYLENGSVKDLCKMANERLSKPIR
jgi:serine/threonine protein kinase